MIAALLLLAFVLAAVGCSIAIFALGTTLLWNLLAVPLGAWPIAFWPTFWVQCMVALALAIYYRDRRPRWSTR